MLSGSYWREDVPRKGQQILQIMQRGLSAPSTKVQIRWRPAAPFNWVYVHFSWLFEVNSVLQAVLLPFTPDMRVCGRCSLLSPISVKAVQVFCDMKRLYTKRLPMQEEKFLPKWLKSSHCHMKRMFFLLHVFVLHQQHLALGIKNICLCGCVRILGNATEDSYAASAFKNIWRHPEMQMKSLITLITVQMENFYNLWTDFFIGDQIKN